ncbi:MAG: cupin domain-containing protein [Polyangiaceae bacterium]
MTTALGTLLGPLPVEAFFRDYFPERHVTVHGSFDRLPAFFRHEILADPRELSRAYRGPIDVTGRGNACHQVHGPDARAFFEELGLSVRFSKIQDILPGAKEWLREVESELGMPRGTTTLSAFVNAPGSGLCVHCDRQEQIAIHVRGPKAFRVRPHEARYAKMQHAAGRVSRPEWLAQSDDLLMLSHFGDDAERIDLRPGSVLYTPRGLYHETMAGDEIALTVVLAFPNPTPAELLSSYLERTLLQSEEWRRPLDRAWSRDPAERGDGAGSHAGVD